MSRGHRIVATLALGCVLPGCAALPFAVVGGALLQAGGGAIVKSGTEYTASGVVRRTFTIPVADVHAAVLQAFRRTEIGLAKDETSPKGEWTMVGVAEHRKVHVRLTPLTRTLTALELGVKRNLLASDRATGSELLAQTEQALVDRRLLTRAADGDTTPPARR
jgi:hypothetical protein